MPGADTPGGRAPWSNGGVRTDEGVQGDLLGGTGGATPVALARVLVDVDLPQLDHPLDYTVPEDLLDEAQPGRTVRVRLAGRTVTGWIVERTHSGSRPGPLQPLLSVVSTTRVVTPETFRLARYVADRHLATVSQVLSLALPQRRARTEKQVTAQEPRPPRLPAAPTATAWESHPAGAALLAHLAAGESPRAVWTALPPTRDGQLADLVRATLASGRSALVVMPTAAQVDHVHALLLEALGEELGADAIRATTAHDTPTQRYRTHLEAVSGRLRLVVGTRSAVWTPLQDLGLVLVWDDGDDRLREQRSPRVDALDVAVARAHLEGCALVAGAHSRSTKAQSLVRSGWAVSLVAERHVLRASTPRIEVPDRVDLDREGSAARARIPPRAQHLLRTALEEGPVLVQVPNAGYVPVVSCQRCRHVARCTHCSGPLGLGAGGVVRCAWCGRGTQEWRCPVCAGTRLRAVRVGSERTGEELGRAFPGTPLTVSSSTRAVVGEVGPEPRLVVATPGAEPRASEGYAAGLVLDAPAIADRPELWAPEEALRRWFNAFALVRPGAPGAVLGGVDTVLAQVLIRWAPQDFADRSLDEREALGFFPAATVIALDGEATQVEEVIGGIHALPGVDVLGTVAREEPGTSGQAGADGGEVRALLRTSRASTGRLLDALREIQRTRASRRRPLVRATVNPPELF